MDQGLVLLLHGQIVDITIETAISLTYFTENRAVTLLDTQYNALPFHQLVELLYIGKPL
jgi:hypothetical protein